MWVKSITACPATPADHIQFVAAWVVPQEDPNGEPVSSVYGDIDKQGNWRVTLPAPNDVEAGATASYFIRANCVVRDPYPVGTPPPDQISQQYAIRPLMVTSTGGEAGGDGPAIPGTTTTTTTTVPTTTTTSTTLGATSFSATHHTGDTTFSASYRPQLDGDDGDVSLDALPAAGTRAANDAGRSDVGGMMVFAALLLGLGVGGWQLARFTKR